MTSSGDGAEGETGEHDRYPRRFGNYVLLQRIASGGMGSVFLAKHGGVEGMEKLCVVKTLKASLTEDDEYVRRFIDEARVVVQLSHRNICSVFDVGKVGRKHYLAMDYVPGIDLADLVMRLQDAQRPLDENLALHITCEVLDALDYAHRHVDTRTGAPLHLVHRDVSPHNVMINFEGEVKLIDFGLAASTLKGEKTAPNVVLGKMMYMPPEQARGERVDARCDVFATAVVAYELLSGHRFYGGKNAQEVWLLVGGGQHLPDALATLTPPLPAVLGRALSGDPRRRTATCAELKDQLEAVLAARAFRGGPRSLRALMTELCVKELSISRRLLEGAGAALEDSPASLPAPAVPQRGSSVALAREPTEPTASGPSAPSPFEALPLTRVDDAPPPLAVPRRSRIYAALVGTLAVAGAAWLFAGSWAEPAPVTTETQPSSVAIAASAVAPSTEAVPASAAVAPTPTIAAGDGADAPARAATKPRAIARGAAQGKPTATSRQGAAKPKTVGGMLTALEKCPQPCAARLVARRGELGELDAAALASFRGDAEKCLARCP